MSNKPIGEFTGRRKRILEYILNFTVKNRDSVGEMVRGILNINNDYKWSSPVNALFHISLFKMIMEDCEVEWAKNKIKNFDVELRDTTSGDLLGEDIDEWWYEANKEFESEFRYKNLIHTFKI